MYVRYSKTSRRLDCRFLAAAALRLFMYEFFVTDSQRGFWEGKNIHNPPGLSHYTA